MIYNDDFDREIYSYFKENNQIPLEITQAIYQVNLKSRSQISFYWIKKTIITIITIISILTGLVFAKDIGRFIKNKFNMGDGVSTAIENGYVSKTNSDFIEENITVTDKELNTVIDKIQGKTKVLSAVMDDNGIGVELYFEFDSILNEYVNLGKNIVDGNIDYENSHYIEFLDFFVTDESFNLFYATPGSEETVYEYYDRNGLVLSEKNIYQSKFSNCIGVIEKDDSSLIKMTLECKIGSYELPHSKKLHLSFGELLLIPKIGNEGKEVILTYPEQIEFDIDLPEVIYDRTEEYYKVVSCGNKDFSVTTAKLTNTGFEFRLEVSNVERPEEPHRIQEIREQKKEPFFGKYRQEYIDFFGLEYVELKEEYSRNYLLIKNDGVNYMIPWEKRTEGCYVINSEGQKFTSVSAGADYLSDNKYGYSAIYSMTKYDATDKITVVIDYMNQPVKIELVKDL